MSIELRVKEIIINQAGMDIDDNSDNLIDNLGLDSLDIVQLFMLLEDEYDIEIPDDDAEGKETVQDVITYIEEKVG